MSGTGVADAGSVDANNFDLKLYGDKINLEVRPANKESKASSRCALLGRGLTRPLSAVPALSLYAKDDNEFQLKTRRPFSADCVQYKRNRVSKHLDTRSNSSSTDNSASTESLIEEKDLPSIYLLQELISEPIKSYISIAKARLVEGSKDIQEDASSSSEENRNSNVQVQPEQFNCLLTPGLTTKPPLPKRPDQKIETLKIDEEIEVIRIKSLQFEKDFNLAVEEAYIKSNDIMSEKEFHNYLKKTKCDLEKQILVDFLNKEDIVDTKDDEVQDRLVSKTQNETNLNNNWEEEEIASKSERKTDGFLRNLKIRHEEIDKCIVKAHKVLEKNKREFEGKENKKVSKNPPPKEKKDKLNNAIETKKVKPKFIAKPITSFKDHVQTHPSAEETWVEREFSKDLDSPTFNSTSLADLKVDSQAKVDNWLQKDINPSKDRSKTNFMEILEKVEDLDIVTRVEDQNILKEIPEHDKEDVSEANTYDDIVQILEALEAEDRKSHLKMQSMKGMVKQELDFQSKNCVQKDDIPNIKITQASRASSATSNSSDQGLGSTVSLHSNASNYNEILSYLDEVDKNCSKSLVTAKQRVQKVTKALEGVIGLDTIPRKEDLRQLTNEELCEQIIDLNLRVKDKSSSIKLLQEELSSLREQVLKMTKETEDIVRQKLRSQKEEHENVVKRHQKFIDQLIADKKALNQQCEGLINEMKLLEDRYNSNMKAADQRYQIEMKKAKEMHIAGEKLRRDRWIEGKTQKIKELTVKSIEPELQSMTLRHQQEISDLRAMHKKELEDVELKSARKMQQQMEVLREQLGEEREKAVAHERNVINQRYEKLVESEEKNYQEQRRRLQQDHAKRILQCEEREAVVTAEKDRAIKIAQDEFEEKLQVVIRRHSNEMKLLKETNEMEMEAWKNNYRKQQTVQLVEKEAKMREKFKKERDREIEDVIERLEAEANESRQQMEYTTENRIRRMREKFENEMKELEQSEKEAKGRYAETKATLLECEDSIIDLRGTLKQFEAQLNVAQEISSKLTSEKENMKDVVRKEMKDEIQMLQKELNQLKNEKDKELQQVYSRVKIAIAKKDEMLQELSRDYAALQEKSVYLESMLEQQRKEYLIK